MWNYKQRCGRYGQPNSCYCKEETSLVGDRSPFKVKPMSVKRQCNKVDILGLSDDETLKKLKPVNSKVDAALIDRIINRSRLPPTQTILSLKFLCLLLVI